MALTLNGKNGEEINLGSPSETEMWGVTKEGFAMKRRGFTLMEALAALALVAVVLPVTMRGFQVALSLASAAKQRNEAAALADSKLNELVATGDWKLGVLAGDFAPNHPEIRWKAELLNWDTSTLQQLNLHVYWNARGDDKEFMVTTLVDQGQ